MLIAAMIRDPDADIIQLLPRAAAKPVPQPLPLQPKTPKQPLPKVNTLIIILKQSMN